MHRAHVVLDTDANHLNFGHLWINPADRLHTFVMAIETGFSVSDIAEMYV